MGETAPAESKNAPRSNRQPTPEFLRQLTSVRRPLVVGHVTPDADCIGAALGVAGSLREHGIEAVVGLPADCVAQRLGFMLELAPTTPRSVEWSTDGRYDSLIIVDTASEKRINIRPPPAMTGPLPTLNIDHHITNIDFGRHNWVDPHASSTCEMIALLLNALKWQPSAAVASLLYAGLHGDTAGFSLPSTTSDALHVAAELVRAGADVSHIGEQLCRSQGQHDFELLRRVYDHTRVVAAGRIAYSHLSYADISESGCKADDIDDQVSIPRALKGVAIAMLFSEGEPGVIRINLRGEGKITVLELAQRFGGGGHSQSAGVRVKNKPMQQVIDETVAAAQEHLRSIGVI
ncbi:MAG TPA: bifunctional oligoribonuclease/PAP phosphatase NrnA [Phycisphaerae bacterium]|nr:bifunctional oligoribonuclease/PAP phosphatase NrnA [Phycisphaerae bacterium]